MSNAAMTQADKAVQFSCGNVIAFCAEAREAGAVMTVSDDKTHSTWTFVDGSTVVIWVRVAD